MKFTTFINSVCGFFSLLLISVLLVSSIFFNIFTFIYLLFFSFFFIYFSIKLKISYLDWSHMYIMAKESVFNVGMLDFAVGLHIVASCKFLTAHGTFMALGPMYIGMMPTIRYSLVATNAAIQCWKCAGQLDEQRWIVNVVITTRSRCTIQAGNSTIFHQRMAYV